jgi:hypothetical protein
MYIAVLTFDRFIELDSFITLVNFEPNKRRKLEYTNNLPI